jgi:hypothetical protein
MKMNTSNLKDKLTNYVALLLAIAQAIYIYVNAHIGKPFDWQSFILTIAGIVISYFTGKAPNGTAKTPDQVASQNAPSGTVIKTLALLIGLSLLSINMHAQSYFFKSIKEIPAPITKKSMIGDVTTTATNAWYFKLDGGVSLTRFQYVGGLEGIKIDAFKMVGLGVSYQKIRNIDGVNYADLTLKALIDFPTVNGEKMGICVGPGLWNNTISFVIGYTIGETYPFLGINGSWNF